MNDQNSTEKSVGFFSLSVIIHALVVFGILAGAAYRATQGGGSKGDSESVTMEMVDSAGDANTTSTLEAQAKENSAETTPVATKVETKSEEKPVVVEKPVEKPVIAAKPEVKKNAETKQIRTKPAVAIAKVKSSPKAIPTETQESEDAPEVNSGDASAAVVPEETPTEEESSSSEVVAATATKATQTKSTEEDIDKEEHQMPAAAAVPARPAKEATTQAEEQTAAATATAAQGTAQEETATVTQGNGNGEGAAKGDGSGATPADAKDFADLKQKPGNRPPKYPISARRAKLEGQVELTYFVSKQGFVEQVKVVKSSGYASLDHEAMQAIQNYKYFPGQEGWTSHPVTFSLQGDAQQVGGLRH